MRSVKCAASPLLQALKILRAQGVRTPVVMVTANALPSQRDAYLRAGEDPHTRACAYCMRIRVLVVVCEGRRRAASLLQQQQDTVLSTAMRHHTRCSSTAPPMVHHVSLPKWRAGANRVVNKPWQWGAVREAILAVTNGTGTQ